MIDKIIAEQCIIALDTQDEKKLNLILNTLEGKVSWVKVGMELYYHMGPAILEKLHQKKFKIFLDLKLHDIPQTVHNAILSLTQYPFDLLTIHLQGGNSMLLAASNALKAKQHQAKILGVSVLTSFSENEWQQTHSNSTTIEDSVNTLVQMENTQFLHGLVCSSFEISMIKKISSLKLVVPGIRWNSESQDQKRVQTPASALKLGADYLVIGREITQAPNIDVALKSLKEHLNEQYLK